MKRRFMKTIIALFTFVVAGFAQVDLSNKVFVGRVDAGGAASTRPAKTGLLSARPGTCTVGDEFFATDATAGANKYYCTATNVWTQQTGGGGGGGTAKTSYTVSFDGLGTTIAGGATRCIPIPMTGPLTAVRLQACNGYSGTSACNTGGSATIDIQTASNASYASTGPTAAASVKGTGTTMSISSAFAADGVLTGWSTTSFGGQTACVVMSAPTAISIDVVMVVN